jgi:hypothetical protein
MNNVIERIRKTTGPDRELDALIICALDPDNVKHPEPDGKASYLCGDMFWRTYDTPKYTENSQLMIRVLELLNASK